MLSLKHKKLNEFLDGYQDEVEGNFYHFEQQLNIKFHRFKTELNQLNNKKTNYIKNLSTIENDYKKQNDFENLKTELEFFEIYSENIDGKIEQLDQQIEIEE